MANPQSSMRFSAEPDPRYCAKALCRAKRKKAAAYKVTIGGMVYLLCAACSLPWESVRGAKVEKIATEEQHG